LLRDPEVKSDDSIEIETRQFVHSTKASVAKLLPGRRMLAFADMGSASGIRFSKNRSIRISDFERKGASTLQHF
jgi:hypothetical protein